MSENKVFLELLDQLDITFQVPDDAEGSVLLEWNHPRLDSPEQITIEHGDSLGSVLTIMKMRLSRHIDLPTDRVYLVQVKTPKLESTTLHSDRDSALIQLLAYADGVLGSPVELASVSEDHVDYVIRVLSEYNIHARVAMKVID